MFNKDRKRLIHNWCYSNVYKVLFLVAWILINILLFWDTLTYYRTEWKFHYLSQLLGPGLYISRGSADVINLNCTVITLPMCRLFSTLVRKCSGRFGAMILDLCKEAHICIAIIVTIATAIHIGAHISNAVNASRYYDDVYPEINLATHRHQSPLLVLLNSVAGVTGIGMVLILIVMTVMSLKCIRTRKFELFSATHYLFLLFYVLLLVHGQGHVLKEQINVKEHVPGCKWNQSQSATDSSDVSRCTQPPVFVAQSKTTTFWVTLPLLYYLIERLIRAVRGRQSVEITKVTIYRDEMVEIEMKKENFCAKPGQFVYMNCPQISGYQWHPFTLTQCPTGGDDTTFTIHVRTAGDWTRSLYRYLLSSSSESSEFDSPVIDPDRFHLYVDGPFGASSQDVFKYSVSVCVGAGVGVTPFAAILHRFAALPHKILSKIDRIYLIWICRDVSNFAWFSELLRRVHERLWELDRPDVLTITLYLTGGQGRGDGGPLSDVFLSKRVRHGRPDWADVFGPLTQRRHGELAVFCCGPSGLISDVRTHCARHCSAKIDLYFNEESFS